MTTNTQLLNKLHFIKTFLGVFPCDNLPILKSFPASLIMNTEPQNKPGKHWVAMYINENRFGLYFDSYGFPPLNEEFKEFLDKNCSAWTYNKIMFQSYNSFTCGDYCVLFILLESLGYSIYDYIHLFTDDTRTNDEIVHEIFKSL